MVNIEGKIKKFPLYIDFHSIMGIIMKVYMEKENAMTNYEKAAALWQSKKITTDAELAEALNGHSIAFAYHSGKIEKI